MWEICGKVAFTLVIAVNVHQRPDRLLLLGRWEARSQESVSNGGERRVWGVAPSARKF